MFTCLALKSERRLGHQLFQIAATIGAAKKYGVDWVLPTWSTSSHFRHVLPQTTLPLHVDKILTPADWDRMDSEFTSNRYVIDLYGKFHLHKFFGHCEEFIRCAFEPSTQLRSSVEQRHSAFLSRERTCVVVAGKISGADAPVAAVTKNRREFHQQILSQLSLDTHFAVMSDDEEWWNARIPPSRLMHLSRNEVLPNFMLGLLCRDVVVADSLLGWWIAWLNQQESRRVFMPSRQAHVEATDAPTSMAAAWNEL